MGLEMFSFIFLIWGEAFQVGLTQKWFIFWNWYRNSEYTQGGGIFDEKKKIKNRNQDFSKFLGFFGILGKTDWHLKWIEKAEMAILKNPFYTSFNRNVTVVSNQRVTLWSNPLQSV